MKEQKRGKVYFIGAGPGDQDLITVKGRKRIQEADLVLYAGSLVPVEVVACAKEGAKVVDSSSMTLDQTHSAIMKTVGSGGMVARVHTGDPSLYGAVREQARLLERDGVDYEIIPGVSVAFATAARAAISFTLPENTQTLILTRTGGKTPVPEREQLSDLASHGCSLAIYLSAWNTGGMVQQLLSGGYPGDTPVVVGYRVGWPDEEIFHTTLWDLVRDVKKRGIRRQAVFLVLPGQGRNARSHLYDPAFTHGFRKGTE
ncbi:MAG: precorrin-4 C(11)-methyltransferase [Deltaproteobacteria bacterium]|nr:MAG: precorrin-4 C(11)-methyltransferase [Deltaproteobacteria bacterium]